MSEGYLHPLYASSFSEFGRPIFLPNAKGWIIRRQIPDSPYYDAMGPYPLFFCENWKSLTHDLENLSQDLICVSFVIAPHSIASLSEYQSYFDVFIPFKNHYMLDLSLPLNKTVSKNKRKGARKALKFVEVHHCTAPNIELVPWFALYNCLIQRHNISGIRAFSRKSFSKQLLIPNTHYFWVTCQDRIIGGNLFFIQNNIAYSHLSAFNQEGYELGASYAVKWVAIQKLQAHVQWINFGGGSEITTDGQLSGLELFKQGWSNQTEKSLFCGKILNHKIYREIEKAKKITRNNWFPSYRKGEYS